MSIPKLIHSLDNKARSKRIRFLLSIYDRLPKHYLPEARRIRRKLGRLGYMLSKQRPYKASRL